jgi:hypothetical protein
MACALLITTLHLCTHLLCPACPSIILAAYTIFPYIHDQSSIISHIVPSYLCNMQACPYVLVWTIHAEQAILTHNTKPDKQAVLVSYFCEHNSTTSTFWYTKTQPQHAQPTSNSYLGHTKHSDALSRSALRLSLFFKQQPCLRLVCHSNTMLAGSAWQGTASITKPLLLDNWWPSSCLDCERRSAMSIHRIDFTNQPLQHHKSSQNIIGQVYVEHSPSWAIEMAR